MLVDARTLPHNHTIQADICIVGAGAAGITLACDLIGSAKTVAVLEGGDLAISSESQSVYQGEVVGHAFTPLDRDRLRFLGGTTNHWSGSCRPFQSSDFEAWPFGAEVMDAYYRRAQTVCQLGPYSYDPQDWKSAEAVPIDFPAGARLRSGVFQYSPPTRFGSVYRDQLTSAHNVTVYLNANVIDIETHEGSNEVTGLKVACFSGTRMRARARQYVLAAGGIETPRLLLNANQVRSAGLGNENDLVGRYFMDHLLVPGAATILADASRLEWPFYDHHLVGQHLIEGYFCATDEVQRKEGLPPFSIGLRSAAAAAAIFNDYELPESLRKRLSTDTANNLAFYVSRLITRAQSSWDWMYNQLWRAPPGQYLTFYSCGPDPNPDSRVTLSDTVDVLGMRRVKLDWRLPPDFEAKMRRAHELLAQELGGMGLARVRLESSATGFDPMQELAHGHHHMGTLRMQIDPRQGVVDENCRVHSLANLFIAGSAVFPSYACDDPTMTIVALSLRLSDHLKSLVG
jgi:choline dehydrogenase-like flavoprotein